MKNLSKNYTTAWAMNPFTVQVKTTLTFQMIRIIFVFCNGLGKPVVTKSVIIICVHYDIVYLCTVCSVCSLSLLLGICVRVLIDSYTVIKYDVYVVLCAHGLHMCVHVLFCALN